MGLQMKEKQALTREVRRRSRSASKKDKRAHQKTRLVFRFQTDISLCSTCLWY
ncbi:MAG: hypothetical protein Ta2A_20400 [Treponemataceae bacterium]|nr:MAG: hypothetical protein Ta2A_20400 [Treponemataceae bacterium]